MMTRCDRYWDVEDLRLPNSSRADQRNRLTPKGKSGNESGPWQYVAV